jgi:hypothetical protein
LNWIASSSNYFAVGPDYYEQIDADSLLFYVDANQVISYPTTQSTWYDLSGNTNNATLGSGVTFNSNGWINFDGTQTSNYNVAVPINRGQLGKTMSVEATFKYDGTSGAGYRPIIGGNDPGSSTEFFIGKNSGNSNFGVQDGNYDGSFVTSYNVFDGRWHHMVYTYNNNEGKLYLDGILRNTGTFTKCNDAEQIYIGAEVQEGYWWHGNISQTKYYIKTLSASDVAQNYYGGPIVTDGLVFAIDAGNLVSYPKSGTTAYDLTGNTNANLRNGTGFSSNDGGTWTFDGTNDFIDVSGVYDFSISQAVTVECWAQSDNPLWNDNGYLVSRRPQFIIHPQSGTNVVGFYVRIGGSFSFVDVTVSDITKWHHYVLTYDGNDLKAYVDGIFGGSTSPGPGLDSDTGVVEIGKDDDFSRFLDGNIASVRLYDTALTSDEVLQNYNATK